MLKTRVISAIISVPIIILPLYIGGNLLAALVFMLSIAGLYEYYKAFKNVGSKPETTIGYISTIAYYFIILANKNLVFFISLLIFLILILLFFDIMKKDKSIIDAAITILSLLYIPFMFSNILFLERGSYGRHLVFLPFLAAWLSDTFAYFIGIRFGKNKLCPKISPNKTIEGSLGGIIASILFTTAAGMFFIKLSIPISLYHYIIIGALSSIMGQTGDLFASYIKRFCNIKDFSNILPGHGGILDRFDSILFTAPTVYFYFKLFL